MTEMLPYNGRLVNYQVNTQAPDLSNIMQLASRTGAMEAKAEFESQRTKDFLKQIADNAKAKQKAEKAAAANDLGNHPQSQSFWDKLGQFAGAGLEHTLDILSRFNYASANAAMAWFNENKDSTDSSNYSAGHKALDFISGAGGVLGANPLASVDDFLQHPTDIGKVLKAGWQGFTGHDKTFYSDVIANNAKRDKAKNIFDSRLYQGAVGFAADVALDPTTYIGAGLVTKPLKKAAAAKIDQGLVEDLTKLNITAKAKDGTEVPLTANDFHEILGQYKNPNARPAHWDSLTRREKKAWEQAHTHQGLHFRKRSQDVARVNQRVEGLHAIRKALRETPAVSNTHLKELNILIQDTHIELAKAVENYGKRAYQSALKKFDAEFAAKGLDIVPSATFKEAVHAGQLSHMIRLSRSIKAGERDLAKPGMAEKLAKGEPVPSSIKYLDENRKNLTALEGRWWGQLPQETRDGIYAKVEELAKPHIKRQVNTATHLNKTAIPNLRARIKHMADGPAKAREERRLNAMVHQAKAANAEADTIRGSIMQRLLKVESAHMQGNVGSIDSRLSGIDAELKRLEQRRSELDAANIESHAAPSSDKTYSTLDEVKQKIADLNAEKAKIVRDYATTPTGKVDAPVGVPDHVLLDENGHWKQNDFIKFDGEHFAVKADVQDQAKVRWAQAIADHLNYRVEELKKHLFDTERRRLREASPSHDKNLRGDLKGMFKVRTPVITENGKTILRNKRGGMSIEAFDKKFAEQHGMSVKDAITELNKREGRAVDVGGRVVASNEFVDFARQYPDKIARAGFGLSVPIEHGEKISWGIFKKRLEDAGNFDPKAAREEWDNLVVDWIQTGPKEKVDTYLRQVFKARLEREGAAKGEAKWNITIPEARKRELEKAARQQAIEETDRLMAASNNAISDFSSTMPVEFVLNDRAAQSTLEDTHKAAKEGLRIKYAEEARKAAELGPRNGSKPRKIEAKLNELKVKYANEEAAFNKAFNEADKARKAMDARLAEQVDLDALSELEKTGRLSVRVTLAGLKLADLPVPEQMVAATEKVAALPILQAAYKAWSDGFKPSSTLEPEMNLARLRMQSRTPELIKAHVDNLMHEFSGIKVGDRKHSLKLLRSGKSPVGEVDKKIMDRLNNFAKTYLSHGMMIGDPKKFGSVLLPGDVDNFLPEAFKLETKAGAHPNSISIFTGQDLLKHLRRMPADTDPMKLLWHLEIAAEQAMAYKNLQHTIKETFGVKRLLKEDIASAADQEKSKLIEALHERHGWVTHKDMGKDAYFPPDLAEQISKLMSVVRPGKGPFEITKLYDKAMRAWKSTVTIYNPGYYTRNGIGETIMNVFDGVTDPRHYKAAASILSTKMPDSTQEALKSLESWKKHATTAQQGARHVVTTAGGKKLNVDDVWVLYNETGLKSGFVSTEYDHYFPSANKLRATSVGQVATKANDAFRHMGEKYEDYFRITHFVSRLARSKHADPLKAAQEAAEYVRKYHFDYTDFSAFEKTTMMRIFPFYKWTRKAMPLMASMVFAKPGAVMLYPKAMTGLSVANGGTPVGDPSLHPKGFYPNYNEVVPEWMQKLMAYNMGPNFMGMADGQGSNTYMNVATPAMDVYKMFQDPGGTIFGMLTPFVKVPAEQMLGTTLDPGFQQDLTKPSTSAPHPRRDELLRQTPATNLINKISSGKADKQAIASYFSGMGMYRNSPERQKGEQFRQKIAGSGSN